MRYIVFLLYSYYSKGPRRNSAYFSAIAGVTFILYMTLMLIAVALDIDKYIPIGQGENRGAKYVKLTIGMLPVFLLLYYGIKEKKVKAIREKLGHEHYSKEFNHRALLFLYIVVVFTATMVLAVMRK